MIRKVVSYSCFISSNEVDNSFRCELFQFFIVEIFVKVELDVALLEVVVVNQNLPWNGSLFDI